MPNHISHRVVFTAKTKKELDRLISFLEDEETEFSLNNIIPMSKEVEDSWYPWRLDNWGTKWNTYDCCLERTDTEAVYTFNTAWGSPVKCFDALAKLFIDIEIDVIWADEDYGYNTGHYWRNESGKGLYVPENESNDAYDFLFIVNEYAQEDFEFIDGKWEFIG